MLNGNTTVVKVFKAHKEAWKDRKITNKDKSVLIAGNVTAAVGLVLIKNKPLIGTGLIFVGNIVGLSSNSAKKKKKKKNFTVK